MTPQPDAIMLDQEQGVEVWKLATPTGGFLVRTGSRRAKLVGSLESAREIFGKLVRQARTMRAH